MDPKRKPLKQDILRLVELYHRQVELSKLVKEVSLSHKPGLYKKYTLDLRSNHHRFKYKTQELLNRLLSPVVSVKYSLNKEIYYSRLTNILPDEVPTLFEFLSSVYNADIKILEIKEIPTYIKSSKL